jgi:hypothetical protein
MIIDVQNEMRSYLATAIPEATVSTVYPDTTPSFPFVLITESSNDVDEETYDSSGETHNQVDLEVEIFTYGSKKKSDAMSIRKKVDGVLNGTYRMRRTYSSEVPNYADRNVYRYIMRFSFKINENKEIYRR